MPRTKQNKKQIETISIRKRRTILFCVFYDTIYKENEITTVYAKDVSEEKRQEKKKEKLIGELNKTTKT
jgi:truncated hemoglobin YjbI